jgi:hypothetical protein
MKIFLETAPERRDKKIFMHDLLPRRARDGTMEHCFRDGRTTR